MSMSSSSSPEDGRSEASASAGAPGGHEPLACVSCRSRKLKCDRIKPVCSRCAKAGTECVYPESRRKPAVKRRNVKELEERLAQVEGLLRNVGAQRVGNLTPPSISPVEAPSASARGNNASQSATGRSQGRPLERGVRWVPPSPSDTPRSANDPRAGELLSQGQFEWLPPSEMIEDLHNIYFGIQTYFLPIVQPQIYLAKFHSPPHMRPPLCLQYAIWAFAAHKHPVYGDHWEVLYRRARQYLEVDELKGEGEHFITIAHAQAWALVAMDEARSLWFTRAAMSTARCVRLVGMMGLHRLDSNLPEEEHPIAPMIPPHKDWVELEERRRVFWGSFCIDAYASISAGWPSIMETTQITTHLPASEEAFLKGTEEPTSTLQDVFRGADYSIFASNIVVCYIFSQLMKHVHRPMPDDRPQDVEYGPWWKRHRELDNMLSSVFMFLPEKYRLPRNLRDPIALQINLNLHAAVICLHNAACDKVDKYKLPGNIKQSSRTRVLTAAQEVVDIIKMTSHMRAAYQGPLMALSLYCAASAYISHARDNPQDCDLGNLEIIIKCMDSLKAYHPILRAYMNQILLDIERNGLSNHLDYLPRGDERFPSHIPIVVRGSVSKHSKPHPPLPRRLPFGCETPVQGIVPLMTCASFIGMVHAEISENENEGPASKRQRTSDYPETLSSATAPRVTSSSSGPSNTWSSETMKNTISGILSNFPIVRESCSYTTNYTRHNWMTTTLPDRTGSQATETRNPLDLAADFSQLSSETATATTTSFTVSSTTATTAISNDLNINPNSSTSTAPAVTGTAPADLNVFDNLGEWGFTDPEGFYNMLYSATFETTSPADFSGTSQPDSMANLDPWLGMSSSGVPWAPEADLGASRNGGTD